MIIYRLLLVGAVPMPKLSNCSYICSGKPPSGVYISADESRTKAAYEQEIEDALPDSLEKLHPKNLTEELAFAKQAAANYLRKDTKINIRLSHHDINGLRRIAVREGLPYQTLIASVLHKFVSHHLEDRT